jgi:hypothetical protein
MGGPDGKPECTVRNDLNTMIGWGDTKMLIINVKVVLCKSTSILKYFESLETGETMILVPVPHAVHNQHLTM